MFQPPRPIAKQGYYVPFFLTCQENGKLGKTHRVGGIFRDISILLVLLVSGIIPCRAESAFTPGSNPCLTINLMSFDADHGDIDARLRLKIPSSDITASFSPRHDYFLVDELTINESVLKIDSETPYSAYNNTLLTKYQVHNAGSQFLYPFDNHRCHLRIFVDRHGKSKDIIETRIPVKLDTSLCSFEGYNVTLRPGPENSPSYVDLQVELERTSATKIFTMFVSALMLLVSIGFMNMVRKFVKSNAPPDIDEMAFGAALLFAFPAIRSIEPSVPPMGVLSDFIGFFWAETIVAISLIIHLYCWMKRKNYDT